MLKPGPTAVVTAAAPSRLLLLGGAAMDGPRHLVELRRKLARAHRAAKADWRAGRFAPVPGETEFIPLPA